MLSRKAFVPALGITLVFIFVIAVFAPGSVSASAAYADGVAVLPEGAAPTPIPGQPAAEEPVTTPKLSSVAGGKSYLPAVTFDMPYNGKVTFKGAPISGVPLVMAYSINSGSSWNTNYMSTTTNAQGEFTFPSTPPVGNGKRFAVYFNNPGGYASYLWYFECTYVDSTSDSYACNFDIQDVVLSSPANNANVGSTVTFSWQRRAFPTDIYHWHMYDSAYKYNYTLDVGYTNSKKITFRGFAKNFRYTWWMDLSTPNGFGIGFDTHGLIFTSMNACSIGIPRNESELRADAQEREGDPLMEKSSLLKWLVSEGEMTLPAEAGVLPEQ